MAFVGRCLALRDHGVLRAYERGLGFFFFLLLLSPFGPRSFVYTTIILYGAGVSRDGDDHFTINW
jgi:hypothetical protein